jgi:hypothetical protein
MDHMNKIRIAIFVEPKQLAALRANEATTGAPIAAQIRIAIDAWLAGTKPTPKKRK